jgi:aldehyde dehydrogenase (NAD+)
MPNFAGKGKAVTLLRELVGVNEIKCTVRVIDPETSAVVVGPCYTFMQRKSWEPPQSFAAELKERFASGISRPLEWRLEALERAGAMALENVEAISAAQAEDHVSPSSFMGASMMIKGAIAFYKASLAGWAAPQPREETLPPFMRTEGDWEVVPEPKGVGLVVAPWNAPFLLCLLPMMGMLAAGNLCVLKPSEATKATSKLVAKLVEKYFPDRSVLVAEGGPEVVKQIIATPVDHILFTGGGEIAKKILALAAEQLTPVSLELGGKNPCFVDASDSENLALYVAEIIGTKSYFGGQFCQAHDYCLVHEKVFDDFVAALEAKISALGERRQCQMINATHARRVRAFLAGHDAIARPALPEGSVEDDRVPLTLLISPPVDSAVMQDELFGPLLPVIRVASAQEAADFVRKRPKPLVAYCYSQDPESWAAFRNATSSGNLAVNAGPQRMQSNLNVGFGGVGESGFGYSIWGRAAFDDYSHHKAVFCGKKFAGSVWGAAPPPRKPPSA